MALVFTETELMLDHPDLAPHVVAGRRMHGGFLPDGTYQPPRALVREPALRAWEAALLERGGALLDADASLLGGVRLPSVEQSKVLLRNGLGQTFWNTLTITGKIEAKGRLLADIEFPPLAPHIVDDISQMAIGHLGKGLLKAHGFDEGGVAGIGAHDEMWFVARDLAFGEGAYPDVDPPENISRPELGRRFMPEVAPEVEGLLSLLMNLLVIEFRAEIGFAATQELLRTPDLFVDRRAQAEEAAEIFAPTRRFTCGRCGSTWASAPRSRSARSTGATSPDGSSSIGSGADWCAGPPSSSRHWWPSNSGNCCTSG
jgi:hypothetical protein